MTFLSFTAQGDSMTRLLLSSVGSSETMTSSTTQGREEEDGILDTAVPRASTSSDMSQDPDPTKSCKDNSGKYI